MVRRKTLRKKHKHRRITSHKKYGNKITFNALTYNLSWASQKGLSTGSEADFVEQCKNKERDCFNEALNKIKELHNKEKFDVIGIQEAEHPDLVKELKSRTNLQGWYRGATWNSIAKVYSGCAIIWNTEKLGKMMSCKTINLAKPDITGECDARTCCIVTTSKNITLIVAHFPWINNSLDIFNITSLLNEHISSTGPIIILADTNDSKTLITKNNPITIKGRQLSHGLTREDAIESLKSCCWHKIDHKSYKHYVDTGDYILSEFVEDIKIPIKTPTNDIEETDLYSDHMPVTAKVTITMNK